MALDFDSSHPYSVVVRLGDIFGGINEANTFASSTAATRANTISDDYLTISRQGEVITDLYTQAKNVASDLGDWSNYFFGLVTATIQTMCRDDTARPRTDDLDGWFNKINRDMVAGAYNWTLPTVTSTITLPGTNIGTGYLIASVVEPIDGLATYYAYSEVLRLECTSDSYSGNATAGAESFAVYGETPTPTKTDQFWPKGSGASTTLTVVDTNTDVCIADGAMELWTLVSGSNYRPTDWDLLPSVVSGTHINREGTVVYGDGGTYSCKLTGDGSVQVGFSQALDQTVVLSNTNYAISFWYRTTSATYTAKLRVAFVDGTPTVITDNAGNSQSDASVDETALGAANGVWVQARINLRTPRNLPSTLALEFRTPSGDVLDNAKSIYIDHIIMSAMEQVYDGGPYMAIHAGAVAFSEFDRFSDAIANNKTTTNFVRCLDRTFDLAANGIRLTVTGSTTINDALIA